MLPWTRPVLPALALTLCVCVATSRVSAQENAPVAAPASLTEPFAADEEAAPLPGAEAIDPVAPRVYTTGILPAFIYGNGMFDSDRPDFVATVRGGVRFGPAYFGSTTVKPGPDAAIRLDKVTLPGGLTFGSNEAVGFLHGFNPRLSGRIIPRRESNDYPEIAGLDNIPFSVELGFGVGYERRNYRAYADMRYGVIGHHSWVGEFGADGMAYPYEGLTLLLGPRVSWGSANFANTYFGISPSEANASGLPAYQAESGIYGAGMEFGARYLFNDRWGIEGAARWTRLVNSAADSPIVQNGTDDQYTVRFDLSRRISLDF